jgi:hypothetical protein
MRMESHRSELNSLGGNEIKLGMMISTIISRMSVGIEVTKGIGLNVMVQRKIISS